MNSLYTDHRSIEVARQEWVPNNGCDLLAMSTHGHRLFGDLFLGATASHVRHCVSVPILMLRAKHNPK